MLRFIQLLIVNKKDKIATAQTLQPTMTGENEGSVTKNYSVNNTIRAYAPAGFRVRMHLENTVHNFMGSTTLYRHVSGVYLK